MVETLGGPAPIDDPAVFAVEYASRQQWKDVVILENIRLAYGSQSELMVVQFILGLLATLALVASYCPAVAQTIIVPGKATILILLGMVGAAAMVNRILIIINLSEPWQQLAFVLPPLAAFGIALAAYWWASGLRHGAWLFVMVIALSWVGFFSHGMKPLAFLLPPSLILVAMVRRYNLRQVLMVMALMGAITISSISAMGLVRQNFYPVFFLDGTIKSLQSKVILRQAETMFCLASAANTASLASANDRNPPDPAYIFSILIPRTLWPDKPNYSQGGTYAVDYCLFPAADQRKSRHSASITLLGEPLLHGGKSMLLLFTAPVVVLLAGAALMLERGPPILKVAILAMTGWLVDFDQHSTLYLGNAVKVALCLLGPALLFHWLSRRSASRSAPGPGTGS